MYVRVRVCYVVNVLDKIQYYFYVECRFTVSYFIIKNENNKKLREKYVIQYMYIYIHDNMMCLSASFGLCSVSVLYKKVT